MKIMITGCHSPAEYDVVRKTAKAYGDRVVRRYDRRVTVVYGSRPGSVKLVAEVKGTPIISAYEYVSGS